MSPKHLSVAGLVIGAAAILAGCSSAAPAEPPPAQIVPVPGSSIPKLQLTDRAIQMYNSGAAGKGGPAPKAPEKPATPPAKAPAAPAPKK